MNYLEKVKFNSIAEADQFVSRFYCHCGRRLLVWFERDDIWAYCPEHGRLSSGTEISAYQREQLEQSRLELEREQRDAQRNSQGKSESDLLKELGF